MAKELTEDELDMVSGGVGDEDKTPLYLKTKKNDKIVTSPDPQSLTASKPTSEKLKVGLKYTSN